MEATARYAESHSQPVPSAPEPPQAAVLQEQPGEDEGSGSLLARAKTLMDLILIDPENPNPNALHALSSMFERQEARFIETGRSSSNTLMDLIQDDKEFFELISSEFLSEARYSVPLQAAATRLLCNCILPSPRLPVFEEDVLNKIIGWVMDETPSSSDDHNCKHESGKRKTTDSEILQTYSTESGKRKTTDSEILQTYSTGLLAVISNCTGGELVKDVLSGLSAKLMRYIRPRVLGEINRSQRDLNSLVENKTMTSIKAIEETRGRMEQLPESSHLDALRIHEGSLDDPDREHNSFVSRQSPIDEYCVNEDPPDGMAPEVDAYKTEADGPDKCHIRDLHEAKIASSGRAYGGEDDENQKDDPSNCREHRGLAKLREKCRISEGVSVNEHFLTASGSDGKLVHTQSFEDRIGIRNRDLGSTSDIKILARNDTGALSLKREDGDYCFLECKVGSKDISDLVKKAVIAAEAEAEAANAPAIAIRAAGDAAAEVVKSAAIEEFRKTNDEEVAFHAASRVASAVIDAGNLAVSRSSLMSESELHNLNPGAPETDEDIGEFFIPDGDSLANLREEFSIECLANFGKYIQVLGPVLHEKGIDVCLVLLQRICNHTLRSPLVLPEILHLISALASHWKFAALFVDRGGVQKLVAIPRTIYSFYGLSSCILSIGSVQVIMERVCALPSNVVNQVVELALQLLECPIEMGRKNASLFFAAAFAFRAVIDAFDAQDGLQKLLKFLRKAASVRPGVSSGTLSASLQKQVAFHTCVALVQYLRTHLLLLVGLLRPNKTICSGACNISSVSAANKPFDISNEAMDAVFRQIQKDRKLGPALVKARWPVVNRFLSSNGHITMLELCQAPPFDRYLHDLLLHALGVLHIVTLVPYSRKRVISATLRNGRAGIAVILDAASWSANVEHEILEPALNVLINLVCPPPSISNEPTVSTPVQKPSTRTASGPSIESRGGNAEQSNQKIALNISSKNGTRDLVCTSPVGNTNTIASGSGLVGGRRISLGAPAGCAGLVAQLEQGYHQAREAVRANNGIKVIIQLLQLQMVTSPAALGSLRALICRVLLGLARDDTIARILSELQVGKMLSELIRESCNHTPSNEQSRWQLELAQVTIELIGVLTNSGHASDLAASDVATPTMRRIERAAIASATPIIYNSRELLLLIHEHLQASGLAESAATLLKEAQLTPLPSLAAPLSPPQHASRQEVSSTLRQWPSGRAPCGFMSDKLKLSPSDNSAISSKNKALTFPAVRSFSKAQPKLEVSSVLSSSKINVCTKKSSASTGIAEISTASDFKSGGNSDIQYKAPIVLPLKHMSTDLKQTGIVSSGKQFSSDDMFKSPIISTSNTMYRVGPQASSSPEDHGRLEPSTITACIDESQYTSADTGQMRYSQSGLLNNLQPSCSERLTLDSLVVQYLKQQHRQCPAPITTLPPFSLMHPHVCPEPRQGIDSPSNVTARLSRREFRSMYGGNQRSGKDRQYIYGRFRPWRTCQDDVGSLLTCITFLGNSSQIATGYHTGELKVFDSSSNRVLETCTSYQYPLTLLQSRFYGETHLILSSSESSVQLWDASSISVGPRHSLSLCEAAQFSSDGSIFAALSANLLMREILLYDTQTCKLDLKLTDASNSPFCRGREYSRIHFDPSDSMLLWNGVLWDRRVSVPLHRFDQFTDFGGGGFHPAGNEVIINSEVWDLRNFKLLRSVPSLDQTAITFNSSGDVIYAFLRRNLDDVNSALQTKRMRHPLFAAFRTLDAVSYSDIATIPVDHCVLDFATDPTDSFVGVITMDDQDEMHSSARVYEIGQQKLTDDDGKAHSEEDEEEYDDSDSVGGGDDDDDSIREGDFDGDSDADADDTSNGDDIRSVSDEGGGDNGNFITQGIDLNDELVEMVTGGNGDHSEGVESLINDDEEDL